MTQFRILLVAVLVLLVASVAAQPVASYVVKGDTNKNPVRICRYDVNIFSSISTGAIASYSWTFATGNPSTSSNSSVPVTWNSNGTKACSLTVVDTGGVSNTINFNVIVASNKPNVNFAPINDFCSSDPGTFLTQGSPSGGVYFGPGVSNNKFFAGVADTGYHTLGYVYTAPNGCSDTAFSTVYVKPGPNASLLELNSFSNCNGFSFADPDFEIELYDQTTSKDSIVHYEIFWGDGTLAWDSIAFRPGLKHTYYGQGIYQLKFVVTALNGCTDTAKYLVVNTTNPASLNMSNPGGTNGCAPVTVTFPLTTTNTDTTITYTIDWGDGSDTTFKHPPPPFVTHTYDTTSCIEPSGFFNIKTTATNACVSTVSTLQGPFVTQPGVAEFTPSPGCVGVPNSLPNLSIPGYTNACSRLSTYIWDFGDGSPLVTQVVNQPVPPPGVHTWMAPGIYNVTLILVSPAGNCPGDTVTYPVCIENATSASVSFGNVTGCQPVTPLINNTSDTSAYCSNVVYGWSVDTTFGWTLTGGTTLNDPEPSFSFTAPGTYTLMYYHINNCGGDTITQIITVRDKPTVILPQNIQAYCDTVTVNTATNNKHKPTIVNNGAPITSYLWKIVPWVPYINGTDSTSQYPQFVLTPNTYTITHWVTNACGTDSSTQTVIVNSLTNGGFNIDFDEGCSPLVVNVQSTSTPGVQHDWYIDSNHYSTAMDTSMVLTNTGIVDSVYKITLLVYSGPGCSDTIIKYATVHPSATANFSVDSVCLGSTTNFYDSSTQAVAPIYTWHWDFGDGDTSALQNPQHTYLTPGIFNASLVVTDTNGCTSQYIDSVWVFSPPMASFNINYSSKPDSACINDSVFLINTSTIDSNGTPIVSYEWDVFDDGSIEATVANTSYIFNTPGSYPIRLTVVSATGCISTVVDTIHVSRPPTPVFSLSSFGGCTPVTVSATDSSYGYILNYLWRFYTLDSNQNQILEYSSVNQNPNPIPPFQANILSNKTVFAELTVSNNCYSATYTDTINIKPIPIPFFAFSSDTGCSPLTVIIQVDGLATGNPDSILFDFGDGTPNLLLYPNINILPNGDTLFTWNQQTHTFSYTGNNLDTTYFVTLYAANECGDSSYTVPINVRNRSVQSFFTASKNIGCAPLNVNFNDFSFAALTRSYCFDFDTITKSCNGNVYFGPSPNHTFTQPGVYVVAQFAANGCGADTSYQVIDVRPKANVQFNFPTSICQGDTVNFINSTTVSAGSIWGYKWSFGDGDSSLLTTPMHIYDTVGTFMVCLEVTTDQSCDSIRCIPITVYEKPVPNFTFNNNVCRNLQPVQFVNQSTNSTGNIISYEWYFGDGNLSTQINPLHTYAVAGTYDVKLVVTNTNFCKDSITKQIVIFPVPDADFSYNILSGDTCGVPQTIQFTNNSNGAGGYYWDFDFGNNPYQDTSVTMHPSYTVTTPGTYRVMLISRNGLGCEDTVFQEIRIHPIPEPDFLPSVTAGCAPLTVYFDNTTKLPQGFNDSIFYVWDYGDGTVLAGDKYGYHTYGSPGTYSVKLTATSEYACEDSAFYGRLITVFPVPVPSFNYVPVEFGIYTFNQVTVGGTPPYSYLWDFGDGTSSTSSNPTHEFIIDKGRYRDGFNVCLTVTDFNGCDSTVCDTVDISAFTLFVPNAMTPDSEGEDGIFLPKGQGLETYQLMIFDRWGNLLWETEELSEDTASPVEGWDGTYGGELVPAGVYIWRIKATFANGIVWRGQGLNDNDVTNSGTITILR